VTPELGSCHEVIDGQEGENHQNHQHGNHGDSPWAALGTAT
jgi:hypothetical protein